MPRPIAALAPMEDVTDTVFRRIISDSGGADVYFTEFVSADGLCSAGIDAVAHRLKFTESERPIVAQIWGNNPEHYLTACRMIRDMGFNGIDINMGCPVKKIVKSGACSALIENETVAAELYRAAFEGGGGLPVSIKTRLGFKKKRTEAWTAFLLGLKPAVITMHGRIAKDLSDVPADWEEIRRVVEMRNEAGSSTLVIGNGDVIDPSQIVDYPGRYGVDGVMVGRGILHNLFLFRNAASPDAHESFSSLPSKEKISRYMDHIRLYRATWGAERNINIMKKFAKTYISGFSGAAHLRNEIMESSDYEELISILGACLHTELG